MYKNKIIHLIGIGGASMSGIAEMLKSFGSTVTGSDVQESKNTIRLIKDDIKVLYGHHPELVDKADIIVYTAAVHESDPERIRAKELNKEIYERAEFFGKIMHQYKNRICISGTHGKSTTTGMISHIFLEAKLNPTIEIGAILPKINSTSYIGSTNYLVFEACEYVDSFLHFYPTAEVITNIDNDHLDYFGNLDNIKKSFNKYTNLLKEDDYLVINNDDINSKDINKNSKAKLITYGIENESLYMAKNISVDSFGHYSFDAYKGNDFLTSINLGITGKQNVYNAIASIALSYNYISDLASIKKGLESFTGVERRFELIGKYNDASIYDDFAHHPTEINTTIESVKKIKHHESWAVFQSHTFTRTYEHMDSFAKILSKFDHVIIAKIYPAREVNTFGDLEDELVKKIGSSALYIDDFDQIVSYLKEHVKKDDIVVTIGAGSINKVAEKLVSK